MELSSQTQTSSNQTQQIESQAKAELSSLSESLSENQMATQAGNQLLELEKNEL